MNLQKYEVLAQAAIDQALAEYKATHALEIALAEHKLVELKYEMALAESHKIRADGIAAFNKSMDAAIQRLDDASKV